MILRLLTATPIVLLLTATTTVAQEAYCRTPYALGPLQQEFLIGAPCYWDGDTGVIVEVDQDGYFAHEEGGNVCYTNFEPCGAELDLVGVDCYCGGVPGVIGIWYQ